MFFSGKYIANVFKGDSEERLEATKTLMGFDFGVENHKGVRPSVGGIRFLEFFWQLKSRFIISVRAKTNGFRVFLRLLRVLLKVEFINVLFFHV